MSYPETSARALKKAMEWVTECQKEPFCDQKPVLLANEAAFRFDLSPKDSEFLIRFVQTGQES